MKRLILFPLLLVVAACSGHTTYRFEVDILSFIPQDQRQGELNITTAQVLLPDDPAGQLLEVPGVDALVDGQVKVSLEVENTGTLPSNLSLDLRLGPDADTNLYDGQGGDFSADQSEISLNPGEQTPLSVVLDIQPGTQAFQLVKSERFRIGARISLSGERLRYTLKEANVTLRLKPFQLIPNP